MKDTISRRQSPEKKVPLIHSPEALMIVTETPMARRSTVVHIQENEDQGPGKESQNLGIENQEIKDQDQQNEGIEIDQEMNTNETEKGAIKAISEAVLDHGISIERIEDT